MRKALVYTVDAREFAVALFAAQRAAMLHPARDFDILIATLTPFEVPPQFQDLGIRNVVVDVEDEIRALELQSGWLPIVAYLRLWVPRAFAGRYDRLFYMDGDTLLQKPVLDRVFGIDLQGHAIGAVLDKEQWTRPDQPVMDFKAQGIKVTRYLNSGVMLIDVPAYNAQRVLLKCLDVHRAGIPTQIFDQSLLNLALQGSFAELSPRWNWQWTHRWPALTRFADPFVLHFGGPPKPWVAHLESTRFPAQIVEDYAAFLTELDAPLAFQTNRRGGLRATRYKRIRNYVGHYEIVGRYLRLMRRVPDPFRARAP